MDKSFQKIIGGYAAFREKYATGEQSVMQSLASHGQSPKVMVVACCDSRVDPSLLFQCDPGDLFIARNVANIIPPYEADDGKHHGTSTALEFGICYLNIKHLIVLGHSQCGGINAFLDEAEMVQDDFISDWVSQLKKNPMANDPDEFAKLALLDSRANCMTFPWIKSRVEQKQLRLHQWYLDIEQGEISAYCAESQTFEPLV